MLETYKSDSPTVAARQVEVQNHTVLSEISILGWEIQVARSQGKPFVIFRAEEWDGRRPRYAATAMHPDYFRKVLQDLAKLPLQRRDQMLTLAYEEPIFIVGGLSEIPKHDTDSHKLWKVIVGDD